MNPAVDFYFHKAGHYQPALEELRALALGCGLAEELKWGVPCYTAQGRNVALLHHFKEYCAVLFPKGALLADAAGLLTQQTANVQAARQWRFTSAAQVEAHAATLRAYLREAVAVEQAGRPVPRKATADYAVAGEWQQALDASPALRAAFAALTPGRQRAYLLHFAAPKLAATRAARVAKCQPAILAGRGLHD